MSFLFAWETDMHRPNLNWIFLIIMICLFADGCARIYGVDRPADTNPQGKKISFAIIPFQGAPDARDSGSIVSDVLFNQLYRFGQYNISTPELVARTLAEQDSDLLSPGKIGSILGVPYILMGRVTEYTYKAGVGETPVIGVTAHFIDASTGAVLWSATRSGTGGGNWFQEDSLSRLTEMICKNLAESLNAFLENTHISNSSISSFSSSNVQAK